MKRILLFSLLMSAFLLANGCVNSSHDYDSRHRPPPDNRPAIRPDYKPGPPPAAHPDQRSDRPIHRP